MIMTENLLVKLLPAQEGLPLPAYATSGSAGLDLSAAIDVDIVIRPGARASVTTGIKMALPEGYEAQVRPRSGLARKHGITVINSPGTIDSDYRGELVVILINLGQEDFVIKRGMRIAQMVIAPIIQMQLMVVDELPDSERGEQGFGSTGL
jgi:dUTP pyrophosphatase